MLVINNKNNDSHTVLRSPANGSLPMSKVPMGKDGVGFICLPASAQSLLQGCAQDADKQWGQVSCMRQREGWSRELALRRCSAGESRCCTGKGSEPGWRAGGRAQPRVGSVTNTTSPRVRTLCQAGAVLGSFSLFFANLRDGCCPFHFTGEKTEDLGG